MQSPNLKYKPVKIPYGLISFMIIAKLRYDGVNYAKVITYNKS